MKSFVNIEHQRMTVNTIRISPSILAADFTRLGEQVREAEAAGADMIHIDVMDGRFVPNITMGQMVVEAVRRVTSLPLDVHLMIVEPERYVESFVAAGASVLSVHLEASPNLHRTLQQIRELNCRAGVALNPHTAASALTDIFDMVDHIIVMTVNPGFGGQAFINGMTSKIAELRAMIGDSGRDVELEVDGGISEQTAMTAAQAGATCLVAGSTVFTAQYSVQEGMRRLRAALE